MSFLEQLKTSIGDFKSYRRLSEQPFGKTFSFLVLFLVLVFVVGGIKFTIDFKQGVSVVITSVADKCPDFLLANGKLTVDSAVPIQYNDGDMLVLIDTTGATSQDVIDQYPQALYVSADRLIIKDPGRTQQILFSQLQGVTFSKAELLQFMQSMDWILVVLGIVSLIWLILSKMFAILVLSLIALIVNGILKANLKYAQLWNIALYATVIPTLVTLVRALVGISVPNWGIIHWGLAVAYVVLALREIKSLEPSLTEPPPAIQG